MAVLPADAEYKLVYKYKSFAYKTIEINASRINQPSEKIVDVFFDINPDLAQSAKASADMAVQKHELMNSPGKKLKEFIVKYGHKSIPGLEFMVQVGAYKYIQRYNFEKLKRTGEITELDLKDGLTRLIIGGSFDTLKKAHDFSRKIIKAGQKDAFVTVIYKGKRLFFEDQELQKLFAE